MSELTRCNYCNLEDIKARAHKKKQCVTLLAQPRTRLGGIEVYVHPKEVEISMHFKEDKERIKPYWVAWMWIITDRCVC